MARIRTYKPDFFKSLDVAALPLRARLTWLGLWPHCDDHGRFLDHEKLIKAEVWPLDDVALRDIREDLDTLAEHGRIVRYSDGERGYLAVTNWHYHQSINRPSSPKYPPPPVPIKAPAPNEPNHCDVCWELYAELSTREGSLSPHGTLTPGREGRGRDQGGDARANPHAEPRPRCPRHKHLPDDDPGPNCIGCRDARLTADQPTPTVVPDWCGNCDEHTRQVERDDGRVGRCPACHPHRSTA